jgi:hypothetical protein
MRVICDCGALVLEHAVPRLGIRPDGRALVKSIGIHINVRPGPPRLIFEVNCDVCGRTPLHVERNDPEPGDAVTEPLAYNVGGLN